MSLKLALVFGDGILLSDHLRGEFINPLDVFLGDLVKLGHRACLVSDDVSELSVLNKLTENLVSVGSVSGLYKTVDVGGYTALGDF